MWWIPKEKGKKRRWRKMKRPRKKRRYRIRKGIDRDKKREKGDREKKETQQQCFLKKKNKYRKQR